MSKYGAVEICERFGLVVNHGYRGESAVSKAGGEVDEREGYRARVQTKPTKLAKLVSVTCCDCRATRMVKPQDVFQVKRCKPCQDRVRRAKNSWLAKKMAEEREKRENILKCSVCDLPLDGKLHQDGVHNDCYRDLVNQRTDDTRNPDTKGVI